MTASILWAFVAVVAFAGWAMTLIYVSKSILPMANALNVLGKLSGYEDEKIRKVLERIQQKQGGIPNPPKVPATGQKSSTEAAMDAVRNAFGNNVLQPIGEQPPADTDGLEVVEG